MKKIFSLCSSLVLTMMLVACNQTSASIFEFDLGFTDYLTMVTSADYAPYESIVVGEDGKNTVVGIDIEIAKAIAKNTGKNLRVIHKNFDFVISDVQNGKADFSLAAVTPTPDRLKQVDFSKSYYDTSDEQVVLIHKDLATTYTSVETLNKNDLKIGAQTGSLQSFLLEEHFADAFSYYLPNLDNLLADLNNNRISALLTEKTVALTHINAGYPNLAIAFNITSQYTGNAVAVAKGNTDFLNLINETIDELLENGQILTWVEQFES